MHRTLEQELINHGNLRWHNCLRSFLRVAETIEHLHRRGYVHGDLRPRIIMYDERGLCYIADMMIVRRTEMVKRLDALQVTTGDTDPFEYAPPEARLGNDDYILHPSFDIWSIGILMYEALTGQKLVSSVAQLQDRGFDTDFKSPVSFDADIPEKFDEICRVCLSPDPKNRYTSSQLLRALRRINESEQPARPRVFISHASNDREFVENHIIRFLESNGVATWYSKATIQSATDWERSILQGLQECCWFLLVMSVSSVQSEWVKDELFWGIDHRLDRIIPVIIDDVDRGDFHIRLRRIQAIDLRDKPDVNNQDILKLINRDKNW
jgi:serine/threonine protein kinase